MRENKDQVNICAKKHMLTVREMVLRNVQNRRRKENYNKRVERENEKRRKLEERMYASKFDKNQSDAGKVATC